VLLKGVHVLGFEMRGFGTNASDELARNEAELIDLFASRRALPYIGKRFALDQVVDALRFVADGKAVGKVVLEVG